MAAELALALVGVGGTIVGTLSSAAITHFSARANRTAEAARERRRELISAVTELMTALAAHRRTMYGRERLRLTGADESVYAEARSESHRTRGEITAPLVTLSMLAPALTATAAEAAQATYALRGAADQAVLDAARTKASAAAADLVAAAAQHLASSSNATTGETP
ncbi:protein kilB [Kitasatospora sp. NPDC001664]